ncbi:hypothetical protein SK069_17360 [Patulibacter brassicae]|jgi:hypothetical protein|uniref:Uncharacterized protein n=1 Tax=Patulibacter brassicae TaxID=1705717 RepID=A0ABU4VNC8_9ACTN|nr:hypothetical protein [Patulibacter brassicae]MDX8153370.1 hypothetical protein [Patulibacter brassicae]
MSDSVESTAILLPLRTSVELFSDPTQPSALARAKQAAVLHDHVFVETGYLDVTLTDRGGMSIVIPPERLTDEHIARARKPPAIGAPMTMAFGREPAPGDEPREMVAAVSGEISMSYGAEWHSDVLRPLKAMGVDWIEEVHTPGGEFPRRDPIGKEIAAQNYADWTDKTLLPGVNQFRRDFIYKSFNRDAAVARELDASFQITSLYEPMLVRHGFGSAPSGATALEIAAPNLGALRWEEILDFREHPGAKEARALLLSFERVAAAEEPSDAADFLRKVSQQVTDALLNALADRRTNVPRAVAGEAVKTGISLIPVVGPFLEKAATAAQIGRAVSTERRSGIAALMKLRE